MSSDIPCANIDENAELEEGNGESMVLARPPLSDPATGPLVFISYRVHPDEPVAAALRELVESSLTPTPRVFVSGLGGLRPSSVGFKPQIQRAIGEAAAFIGVITPASRDREWIFFEAGAAFGRQSLYLPLLVDVAAEELPTSIADYQACRATNREDVERSLSSIASQIGCEMRQQFGKRFARFRKRLAEQRAPTKIDDGGVIQKVTDAWGQGRKEEAESMLAQLEQDADGEPNELARVRIFRLHLSCKGNNLQILRGMKDFDASLQATPLFAYWQGIFEPRPGVAIASLRRSIELATSDFTAVAAYEA